MEFKAGDRVHVTRLDGYKVDFYATLREGSGGIFILFNCTNVRYVNHHIWKPERREFGKEDYYTLATDEEDTEAPEVQHITEAYNRAKLKNCEDIENMQVTQNEKIKLDNHYIIEVKKGLYVALVTSNGYLKLTKDIKKADVYEYKNAALKHAEFVDGRVLNLKRYVEVG